MAKVMGKNYKKQADKLQSSIPQKIFKKSSHLIDPKQKMTTTDNAKNAIS